MRIAALDLVVTRPDVAVAGVAALLDDTDSRVVEAAAWACGEKVSSGSGGEHGPRAAEPIAPAAGSEAEAVVEKLVRVATTHDDALCRESAIAALGAIGDPRGLPAVLGGLDDKPAVRRRAVIALAPFDGPEVEAALERAGRGTGTARFGPRQPSWAYRRPTDRTVPNGPARRSRRGSLLDEVVVEDRDVQTDVLQAAAGASHHRLQGSIDPSHTQAHLPGEPDVHAAQEPPASHQVHAPGD